MKYIIRLDFYLLFYLIMVLCNICYSEEYGYIDIKSDDVGKTVYIDDKPIDTVPIKRPILVIAGTHKVMIGSIEKYRAVPPNKTIVLDMNGIDPILHDKSKKQLLLKGCIASLGCVITLTAIELIIALRYNR